MLFYNSLLYSISLSLIIIFVNFVIFYFYSTTRKIEKNISNAIFFISLIFTIFYLSNDILSLLKISPGSDAISYYFNAEEKIKYEKIPFIPGHNFFLYLVYILKKLSFDFVSTNFLFGLFSSISSLIFYDCISKYFTNKYDNYIILFFIFLPSYNFWSSGISKDTITIFLFSVFILSFIKNNLKYFLISLVILSFIRLHFAYLVILSFLFTSIISLLLFKFFKNGFMFFGNKINFANMINLSVSLIFLSLFIFYFFYPDQLFRIKETIDHFQSMYPGENFIKSTNFFMRALEYLFRPFLWEEGSLFLNFIKIENLFLLILLLFLFYNFGRIFVRFKKVFFNRFDLKIFILISFIFIAIFQILLTSNYGIALRQKWSFIPGIVFLLYYLKFFLKKNITEK